MKISCIDIGGTYIKSGVLEDGMLTGVEETPTDGGGGARAMLSRVAQLVRQTPGVERVGVSTAGEVDARTGVIRLSDNIPGYTGLNPRQILEGELGLPVAVENDVNAAAAGEFAFGAARDEQDFLMVSYGTGVGGAVYIGGRLYRGRAGSAGEFGGARHASRGRGPGAAGHGELRALRQHLCAGGPRNGALPGDHHGTGYFCTFERSDNKKGSRCMDSRGRLWYHILDPRF